MKGRPYNIIWYGYCTNKIKIDLPNYFSNFKYIKIKVKEVFSSTKYFDILYLRCEDFYYDRIYQETSNNLIRDCVLNISRYLEGGNKLSSFKIPYKKEINMSFVFTLKEEVPLDTLYISFEFTPID